MKKVLMQGAAACFLLIAFHCGLHAENPSPSSKQHNSPSPVATEKKIYVDPVTGQRTAPPAGTVVPAATNRVSTSSEGLAEVPVTTKPGGFKVHLGGRFQATITATNTASGKLETRCVTEPQKRAQ